MNHLAPPVSATYPAYNGASIPARDDVRETKESVSETETAGDTGPDGPLLRLIKDRRAAFLLVGGVNTVVGFLWFVVFQLTVGAWLGDWGYMVAFVLAHIASVLCAFYLYRRLVFRVRGHLWLDLARFEVVQLTAFGINLVALPVLVQAAGIPPIPANAIITVVTVTVSYFAHQYFSFRRKESDS